MLFELTRCAGFRSPMTRIMNPRREFISEQSAILKHKEFQREDPDIVEGISERLRGLPCARHHIVGNTALG